MAQIQIGEQQLALIAPAQFGDRLVAVTGCSLAEHIAALERGAHAAQLASALRPLLADIAAAGDVGAAIAADPELVRQQLLEALSTASAEIEEGSNGE